MQKILILAALPDRLRLDKEIREIKEAIQRAARRDLFEIREWTAVRPQDIRRAVAEERPEIVHFCGHGLEDGSLVLEDDGGNHKPVSPQGLASLFKLHADYVNCVLLNACHSAKPADAISQYINYAIGMNQEIEDKAAIAFAQGFYDALGYKTQDNQDVFQRAFDEGLVAIQIENLSEGQIPVIKKKPEPITFQPNPPFNLPCDEVQRELNNSDIERFTELLIRSGRAEYSARRALCIKAGIEPNLLGFLKLSADADFALELISYLHSIDDKQALWKICKELEVTFKRGKYAAVLETIKSKLNCQ